jgi:4-amino-4-deoxychorismate lyase
VSGVSSVRLPVLAVLGRGVVDPLTPVVSADDAGLTRGDGCFEGCRLHEGTVDKLDAHLARFARSAASLDIAFDAAAWRALLAAAVAAWEAAGDAPAEAAVKLVLTRGRAGAGEPTGYVWITELSADITRLRRDGVRVITLERGLSAEAFAEAPWLLGGVKTLSYAVNMAALREAERRAADDVIFVSADGFVLESPTGSVVWTDGRTLCTTPTGATGILAGTTQHLLFERAAAAGRPVAHTLTTVEDLHSAQSIWLISSVRGPVEVVELDGKTRERRPDLDSLVRSLAGF